MDGSPTRECSTYLDATSPRHALLFALPNRGHSQEKAATRGSTGVVAFIQMEDGTLHLAPPYTSGPR